MRRLRAFVLAAVAVVGTSCGAGSGPDGESAAGCGPTIRERLDPSTPVHLLPGAPEPDYLSEPPTSGPHLSGQPPQGVVDEPLDRPTQVLILEVGGVVVQHRDVDDAEVAPLAALAGNGVVVAPNPDLPAPVVATAWLAKRTCDEVDVEALSQFIDEHLGLGPDGDEAEPG